MIGLGAVYALTGLVYVIIAAMSARDRANPKRWANALFWGLFALSFLMGDALSDFGNGLLALGLVALAGLVGLGVGKPATTSPGERRALALSFGNRLFLVALTMPAVTLAGALTLKSVAIGGQPLFDPAQITIVSLALGTVVATLLARVLLKQKIADALQEGRRLLDLVSWAALLPQMLASLGAVFALAGVGRIVGDLAAQAIPADSRFATVAAYTIGMALFTAIMGNAFAAFPVLTAGIGLPLIAMKFGGDPAIMAAIGMLSGFCGTLTTPMAANFNLVPVALLGIQDRYAVIKAQLPTAVVLLLVNTVLMYVFVFRS
jgi:uncharacterized membrane protein